MNLRRRLSQWRNHTTIRAQLSLIGGTILLLSCGLLILYSFLSQRQANEKQEAAAIERVITLEGEKLRDYLEELSLFSLHLRNDSEFLSYLVSDKASDYTRQQYLESQFRQDFYSRTDLIWMELYLYQSRQLLRIDNSGKRVLNLAYLDPEELEDYSVFSVPPAYLSITPDPEGFIRVTRTIINAPQKTPLAVIRFLVSTHLPDTFVQSHAQHGETLCLFSADGTAITSSGLEAEVWPAIQNGLPSLALKEGPSLLVVSEFPEMILAVVKPFSLINASLIRTLNMNILIGFAALFVMAFILLYSIRHLTRPLSDLSRKMREIGQGDFQNAAHLRGSQEITGLSEEVNHMTENLSDLIRRTYVASLNERTAQLSALEAQINPHFLFNTLQAIGTEALNSGNQEVYRMITALSALLRYTIRGGNLIELSTELEYVRKYLSLQKARFGARLNYEIQEAEELNGMEVPKLGLLALVENAIIHGMADRTEPLRIQVVCEPLENMAELRVINDGNCIPPAKLEEIRQSLREETIDLKKNIGLGNLASRLRLLYGGRAEIGIDSEINPERKTTVRILIPKEVRGNVQDADH